MRLEYTKHWNNKKKFRPKITDDLIKYAIQNSDPKRDKHWKDALNAVKKLPQNGRTLKVVYRITGKNKRKIITAFWLD